MGGEATEGRRIFFEKVEASCVRCHKIGGEGGEAGPVLDRPEMNRKREYLVESIVSPNKVISPGFETVTVFLKNEDVHSGIVKSETDQRLVLISADAGEVSIAKADIDLRRTGLSGMPEGIMNLLSKRDLRDLVEFLTAARPTPSGVLARRHLAVAWRAQPAPGGERAANLPLYH
jgi:quinoprotein glucose dehydrogenase